MGEREVYRERSQDLDWSRGVERVMGGFPVDIAPGADGT